MADRVGKNEEKSTIVLDEGFAYDLFESYMLGHGWTLKIREVVGEEPDRTIEEVWGKDTFYGAVHYMDQQSLYTSYLWIHGRSIWPIVVALAERLGGPNEAELLERVSEAETTDELVVAIIQLAIGWADRFDADVLDILRHYAKHEDSRVRSVVIQGLLFTKWPQGLPILRDLADNDEAPIVRDFASKVHENVSKARGDASD